MTLNSAFKTAFWAAAAAVLVLSLTPTSPELPSTGWDKTNHLFGFLTLALLGAQAYSSRLSRLFVGLLLFGGLIELLQSLTPYRFAEWADWIADGLGIAAGYGLHLFLCRFSLKKRKADAA